MHSRQRLEMAPRLDAGPDDRERSRRLARQQLRRDGRHRRRPRLRDVAAVEERDERARFRIHQHDRREVRVEPARVVAAEDGDDLRAERFCALALVMADG